MSLKQQGNDEAARTAFESAQSLMKPIPTDTKGHSSDDHISWLAYKEAKSMLGLSSESNPDESSPDN